MVSVLESEAVLDTARAMDHRDALRADPQARPEDKENRSLLSPPKLHLDSSDDEF